VVTTAGNRVMHVAVAMNDRTQPQVCEVIQFLADKGAKLDERDAAGRTPRQLANRAPIDKAVALLGTLIRQSGATPKISPR